MTNTELSNEFDVLYNNITSNQAPGLNEYEKSIFLTKAQSQLITEYFNGRTDGVGGGFDGSQKRQYDFSKLILTKELKLQSIDDYVKVDQRSAVYAFPEDYFLSVNEILRDEKYQYNVIPLGYEEYSRLMMKPYNFPVKRAVWRLFTGEYTVSTDELNSETTKVTVAEIIGKPTMTTEGIENVKYVLRYIKKPAPIILENLSNYGEEIKIDGKQGVSDCELPEATHHEILERAVTLAKIAWQGGTGTLTQAAAAQNNNR